MAKKFSDLTPYEYADLISRIVDWIATRQYYPTFRDISRRYRMNLDEVADVIGDSEVYGAQIMPHALRPGQRRGDTTVELIH